MDTTYPVQGCSEVGQGGGGGGGGGAKCVCTKVPPPTKVRGTKPYTYEFAQLQCTLLTFTKQSLCLFTEAFH